MIITGISGKLECLSGSLVALDSIFRWLVQGTVSMLNVTSETEPTDVGPLHDSVVWDGKSRTTRCAPFGELNPWGL